MSVALHTTFGILPIKLHYREAPKTCRNFIELCKAGYYDGVIFHVNHLHFLANPKKRVVEDYLCQTGDPLGDGSGGESIYGKHFEDEIVGKLSHDKLGVVSMANTGRNKNGSQFFITLRAVCNSIIMSNIKAPRLDGEHTIFGQIGEKGFDTLAQFKIVRTKNKRPVKIIKMYGSYKHHR